MACMSPSIRAVRCGYSIISRCEIQSNTSWYDCLASLVLCCGIYPDNASIVEPLVGSNVAAAT